MYNKHSLKATEFIDDEEIKETLCFAQENKHNKELISSLIERAADCKGLTHREAAVLLECDLPEENEKMFTLAKQIKQKLYGNRMLCLLRCIFPTTVLTAVYTVPIIIRTSIFEGKS